MNKKQKGLTLVEVMVVVAIISILATIVYPMYTDQLRKSRRASAKVALTTLAQAQERFFTLNNGYASAFDSTGSAANKLDVSGILNASGVTADGFYTIAVTNTGTTAYRLTATPKGTQVKDYCSTFRVDQTGNTGYNSTGNVTCW